VAQPLDYQGKPRRKLARLIVIALAGIAALVIWIVRDYQARNAWRNGMVQVTVEDSGTLDVGQIVLEAETVGPLEIRTQDPVTGQWSSPTTIPSTMSAK
jgi:hypothetical protein